VRLVPTKKEGREIAYCKLPTIAERGRERERERSKCLSAVNGGGGNLEVAVGLTQLVTELLQAAKRFVLWTKWSSST
jgi:hypothetical protein